MTEHEFNMVQRKKEHELIKKTMVIGTIRAEADTGRKRPVQPSIYALWDYARFTVL